MTARKGPSYASASLYAYAQRPRTSTHGSHDELEGMFDFVGDAFKSVGKAISGAANAIDKAYVSATPQWLRKGLGVAVAPMTAGTSFTIDAGTAIANGQRIDRALIDAAKNQAETLKSAVPLAQIGLSFIPGIGQGVSAALGAAMALVDGKPITDALIEGVKGAIPGGPIVQKAVDIGAHAAVDLASGKSLDTVALNAIRNNLPGGEAAKAAFDTGLALAQGKKLQEAAMKGVEHFVPNDPMAQRAFALTKDLVAKSGGGGGGHPTQAATQRKPLAPRRPPPKPAIRRTGAPLPTLAPRRAIAPHVDRGPAPIDIPTDSPSQPSHAVPIAIGAALVAAAGGGAWWWLAHRKEHHR